MAMRNSPYMVNVDGGYLKGLIKRSGLNAKDIGKEVGLSQSYMSSAFSKGRIRTDALERVIGLCDGDMNSALLPGEKARLFPENVEFVRVSSGGVIEGLKRYITRKYLGGVNEIRISDLMKEIEKLEKKASE